MASNGSFERLRAVAPELADSIQEFDDHCAEMTSIAADLAYAVSAFLCDAPDAEAKGEAALARFIEGPTDVK